MLAFIARRLLQSVLVLASVGLVSFVIFEHVGDPVASILGTQTTPEARVALRGELGLDDPVVVRYARYMARAVRGDFGVSYTSGRPVLQVVGERVPATVELGFAAMALSLLIGLPLGVYTAIRRDSWLARTALTSSLVGLSLPTFVVAIGLIFLFAVLLGWLPSFGRGEVVRVGWWSTGLLTVSGLASLAMPALSLAVGQVALILRLVRAEMLEALRSDYVRFARARGLSDRAVHFGHALRNTLVPVITITGLQLGFMLAFAIVAEVVFQWPGLGLMFIQSLQITDVPVMSGFLLLVGMFFVVINLIVDLLYFAVDPRLRLEREITAGHVGL